MTLVLLAGGFGTRFGGPKQFMPVGPNGECLLHYSIAEAARAGFDDFVLLTRREISDAAEEAVFPLCPLNLRPRLVFQPTPDGKARGTGHAVMSCGGEIAGHFLVCNADDHYGEATFRIGREMLDSSGNDQAVMVPFLVENTLSENGGGSRARVIADGDQVQSLLELRDVERKPDGTIWGRSEDGEAVAVAEGTPVSMNVFGFGPWVFDRLAEYAGFVDESMPGREIGLPQFLNRGVSRSEVSLTYRSSPDTWFGLTFPEDLDLVKSELAKLGGAF